MNFESILDWVWNYVSKLVVVIGWLSKLKHLLTNALIKQPRSEWLLQKDIAPRLGLTPQTVNYYRQYYKTHRLYLNPHTNIGRIL